MARVSQSKHTYTLDQSVEHFLDLIVTKRIVKEKAVTDQNILELKKFFTVFPYGKCYDQIFMNLAYFIRYDLDNFDSRIKQLRSANKNTKEWYKIQMGDEGIIEWKKHYFENPNLKSKEPGGRSSKSALTFFKYIDQVLKEQNINVRSLYQDKENNNHEFRIRDDNMKWFCYDYTIKDLNLIIEYHGEHCHPRKEQIVSDWKHFYSGESAENVFRKDFYKQRLAESKGYKYHIIWHSDSSVTKNEKINSIFKEFNRFKSDSDGGLVSLPKKETVYGRRYIVTLPDGNEVSCKGYKSIIRMYNISNWNIEQLLIGNKKDIDGYRIRREENYD